MSPETNLTLEQRLQVQIFETRTQDLSLEQAQEFLMEMFRQMLVKDNLFAKLTES
ncbi:phycobilisome degradation protein NblA [Synechococcus moorigangaii CMS01]|nr:phycobilisome degradation protein NblA [Synechococcus moorigangaii CMS01]